MRTFASKAIVVALASALAVGIAACGGSSNHASTSSTSASGHKASGAPIKVGFVTMLRDPIGDFTGYKTGADAARGFINEELGGVDGRPIEFVLCETTSTSGGDTCANKMVQEKPVAVIAGVNFTGSAMYPILAQAGIPVIGMAPNNAADYGSAGNLFFTNGANIAMLTALPTYAAESLGAKKVAVTYPDVPSGVGAAQLVKGILAQKGVTNVTLVPEKLDAADFTANLSATAEGHPDVIIVSWVAPQCQKIMQLVPQLGIKAKMLYLGACSSPDVLKAAGDGAKGAIFALETLSDPSNANVKIFQAQMLKRTNGAAFAGDAAVGFSNLMVVADVLRKAGAQPTNATVLAALKALKDQDGFLFHPLTCTATPKIAPTVCNPYARIVEVGTDGKVSEKADKWFTGAL